MSEVEKIKGVTRRSAMAGGVISAAAVGLLAGVPNLARAHSSSDPEADVSILNVALALEHEAIAAYQIAAESGLVTKAVLPVAILFQSHHKEHRDALISTIDTLGGRAVKAQPVDDYARGLNAASLKNQTDVLELAAKLELGAANAYLGVIPSFSDPALGQVSARLAADETMHWTVLAQALGKDLPQAALSFGG